MSFPSSMPLVRHVSILAAAIAFAAGSANAQFASSSAHSDSLAAGESSSSAGIAEAAALPAAPSPTGSAASQEDGAGGYHHHGIFNHLTYEAGGGFNAPSSDSSPYITWGGNFTVGAGYRMNSRLSVMTEYQFIDDKLPGALIAETGANGGNAHIWSFTVAPVVDLMPKRTNDFYVTGGGGFYRKVTNFTDPEPTEYCDYYYCEVGYANQVVGHFSSNQGGWNVGGGFTHKLGGMYGEGKTKLFAEVRYLDVLTPAVTSSPNGLNETTVGADTKLVPVTVGIRF